MQSWSIKRWWWLIPVLVLVLGASGFVIWGSTPLPPMPEALAALQSDSAVQVQMGRWLTFEPREGGSGVGLILYPGGRVDPRAYAPAAHALAIQGVTVVIVPMPLNLAVLAPNRAAQVPSAFPEVQMWAIGGHSLGGAMAARFVYQHPGLMQGLVLWAAYPAGSNDLSQRNLPVVSIYASQDGLATPAKIAASHPLLPAGTEWVEIPGGNHAQFGWYGPQPGDKPATIGRAEQQALVVAATWQLLKELE